MGGACPFRLAAGLLLDRRQQSKGPGWRRNPDAPLVPVALIDVAIYPAPTITSQSGAQWVITLDNARPTA